MNKVISIILLVVLFSLRTAAQCDACYQEVNVISNGNFSQGNTGFTTDLTLGSGFICPLCPEGTYAVGSIAFFYHSDFIGFDHTNPPSGQFMIANGTAQEGVEVWCQTVTLEPQTEYSIRYWGRDVTNNSNPHPLAVLHVAINGELVGDSLVAEGDWQENVVTWNSGDLTTAEICIVNYQSNPGGNDFGLDDISMTACVPVVLEHSANAGTDLEVCSGESIQLGIAPLAGYNYSWQGEALLQNSNGPQPTFQSPENISFPTAYYFTLSLDSANVGCVTQDELMVMVNPLPTLTIAGPNQICEGEEALLEASGNFEVISWNTGATTSSILASTSDSFSALASLGQCNISSSFILDVIDLPELELGPDVQICETAAPYILSIQESALWNTGVTSNSIEINNSGQFTATITLSDCSISDTINVIIDSFPSSSLLDEYTLCQGSTIDLNSGQSGLWNTGVLSNEIQVDDAGLYTVQITNGQCQLISSTVVIEKSIPSPSLPQAVSICEGESIYLDPGFFEESDYLWNDGETNPIYRAEKSGIYEVEVGNECGTATASTEVSVELCDWGLYIPNAFTQDDNGVNDDWVVKGYNVSNVKIYVYNRFGDMIFFTEQLESPWSPDILEVGQDAYTYRVEALNYNGVKIERHGHIRLLR